MTDQLIAARGGALMREIPIGRFGEPMEVASVLEFLISPSSSYVNGQIHQHRRRDRSLMTALDRLDGRVCPVTGGAQGIGLASGLALASRGATIACLDLDGQLASAAAGKIRERSAGPHVGLCANVVEEAQVQSVVAQIEANSGARRGSRELCGYHDAAPPECL